MALSIVVRLRDGRYDAAGVRPSDPEWPPHPARVFCALVASAFEEADWAALGWLERAGAPEVWASPHSEIAVSRSAGYVVTNTIDREGGSQVLPGRTNGYRERVGVLPAEPDFALVWPDAEPDDATLGRLVRLARRVPYVGRSTASAELAVVPAVAEPRPSWTVYRPTRLGVDGAMPLRVAYPGYLDALRAGYERGGRAWESNRLVAYIGISEPFAAAKSETTQPATQHGPYRELLIWGIRRGRVPISGDRVLAVTDMLRRAVISRVDDPVPALICGHGADGRPHVAYLGLPDVGGRYADGHLLGVAVAIPDALDGEDRRALLRALLAESDPLTELVLPWGGPLQLEHRPERTEPRGLTPRRWTAGRDGARTWVSATPMMLDRYPKRRHDVADLVARSFITAAYPEPRAVEILPASAVRGGIHRPRLATVPNGRPIRPLAHCRIEFASPVVGPVIAGSLRYLGLGLFVPEWSSDADAS